LALRSVYKLTLTTTIFDTEIEALGRAPERICSIAERAVVPTAKLPEAKPAG